MMWAPTLAAEACSLPPEKAQFAARGSPLPLTTDVRGPDDDPIPIDDPDDDDYSDDDDEEEDEEDDSGDEE